MKQLILWAKPNSSNLLHIAWVLDECLVCSELRYWVQDVYDYKLYQIPIFYVLEPMSSNLITVLYESMIYNRVCEILPAIRQLIPPNFHILNPLIHYETLEVSFSLLRDGLYQIDPIHIYYKEIVLYPESIPDVIMTAIKKQTKPHAVLVSPTGLDEYEYDYNHGDYHFRQVENIRGQIPQPSPDINSTAGSPIIGIDPGEGIQIHGTIMYIRNPSTWNGFTGAS